MVDIIASSTVRKAIVMLAKAGIQDDHGEIERAKNWIPVVTGMTEGKRADFESRFPETAGIEATVVRLEYQT